MCSMACPRVPQIPSRPGSPSSNTPVARFPLGPARFSRARSRKVLRVRFRPAYLSRLVGMADSTTALSPIIGVLRTQNCQAKLLGMPRITFLLGLCGSGKTWLADRLVAETGAEFFEGVHCKQQWPAVRDRLLSGVDCVVEEIHGCEARYRETLVRSAVSDIPDLVVEWVCFENDVESANWNVDRRPIKDAGDHRQINESLTQVYSCPDHARTLKITRI